MQNALQITLLAVGFGFVIFWHELGHFLAAKWVGIKVEQFAVGFGQAVLAWRKGVGVRVGTTRPEYERRINEYLGAKEKDGHLHEKTTYTTEQFDAAGAELGMGETEYRLNWIPLGGYVKMLGQDDMNPNAISEDPRAYPQKSVGARMLVISAGVIMNIILAALLFMGLFTFGHKVAPAIVGGITPGSPAQHVTQTVNGKTVTTSLQVGDVLLYLDGKRLDDWTKVGLTAALADPSEPTSLRVRHREGDEAEYQIMPERGAAGGRGGRDFLQLGIEQPRSLRGPDIGSRRDESLRGLVPDDYFKLDPGDAIVAVEGQPVDPGQPRTESIKTDFPKLYDAVQRAGAESGRPVKLTVRSAKGEQRQIEVRPRFVDWFGTESLNFAGLLPRTSVREVEKGTTAAGKLQPGDIILNLETANDPEPNPTFDKLTGVITRAGERGQAVTFTVMREGQAAPVKTSITPKTRAKDGRYLVGFGRGYDADHPVVAGTVKDSPAAAAGVPPGSTIRSIAGQPVKNWYDIQRMIAAAPVGEAVELVAEAPTGGAPQKFQLKLAEADRESAKLALYDVDLPLVEQTFLRKASNPLAAAAAGVTETRDFILQFYVTIRRMFGGSISYTNLMGPLGIFTAGTQFAGKGLDWLVWFLAMISANLAVVNFLPIPVVDGGHFVFLCLEKIQGKPVSQRMQSIAQVVGLALLLGVFLLVTYQDIMRMANPF
jgi:regulator of sigma E protease